MEHIESLLNENQFLKILFESIPCSVMVVDGNRNVKIINQVFTPTFQASETEAREKLFGEAIRCLNKIESPEKCGSTENCMRCQLLATAHEALSGQKVRRKRVKMQLVTMDTPSAVKKRLKSMCGLSVRLIEN